jgi:hypothetical protein
MNKLFHHARFIEVYPGKGKRPQWVIEKFSRLKEWWFDLSLLFAFEINVWLTGLNFEITVLGNTLSFKTHLPYWNLPYFDYQYNFHVGIGKNLFFEVELMGSASLGTRFSISQSIHSDMVGFEIVLSLLGHELYVGLFDNRPWDYENNTRISDKEQHA